MTTQILSTGTQIINTKTQIIGDSRSENLENFTGGLLQKNENISGWSIIDKINVQSGEADLYIVEKADQKAVLKYYRGNIQPKKEILKKIIKVNHLDVIHIYNFGDYKNHFFEIMEYAEGGAINSKNEDGTFKYLPLSEKNAIDVCKEIIEFLKTCHENKIIHRDIKPSNIFFRNANGTDIVIGDFGISSLLNEDEILHHKTVSSSRTTGYAAPEILSNRVLYKTDYYSLGITLWEILTGKDPFVLENGKHRNDKHLMRDTIEGRIVDDLLSREPQLSDKMQHLIRGLLVINPDKRWGYEEVTKHLNGEYVEVAAKEETTWTFKVAGINCSSLEEIGNALSNNIDSEDVKKIVYRGFISSFLEDKYPEIAKKISEITEENSVNGTLKLGIYEICWVLKPDVPFVTKNGFKAENIEDILNLLQNAPEEMISELKNDETVFYKYLNHLGYNDKTSKIKNIADKIKDVSDFEKLLCLSKIFLILKDYYIKPFTFGRFKDFELSEIEQLHSLPEDLIEYTYNLISQKSLEGHLYTWLLSKIEVPKMEPIKSLAEFKTYISEVNMWISSNKTKTKDLSDEQEKKYLEAENLFFDKGNIIDALREVKNILAYDEYNQKVLFLYLCLLNNSSKNELNNITSSINYESLGYNLFMILKFINADDYAKASRFIEKSLLLWPNSFLLKCLNVLLHIRCYSKSKDQALLESAERELNSFGVAQTQLELSWQVKLLNELSVIKGNEPIRFDKKLCEEKSLYYKFMSSNERCSIYMNNNNFDLLSSLLVQVTDGSKAETPATFVVSKPADVTKISLAQPQIPVGTQEEVTATITGYNFDIRGVTKVKLLDSNNDEYTESTVEVPLETNTSETEFTVNIPLPTKEGVYTVAVFFDDVKDTTTTTLQVYRPPIISEVTIPLAGINYVGNVLPVTINGKNFTAPGVTASGFTSTGATLTNVTIISDTKAKAEVACPYASGTTNVTVSYGESSATTTLKVIESVNSYAVGDIILTDGSKVSGNKVCRWGKKIDENNKPIGVVAMISDVYGVPTPKVIGLQKSASTLRWAPTTGYYTKFTNIVCTPSQTGTGAALTATFTGDTDGSDNWEEICAVDPDGTQDPATNYPAFNFANTYGTTAGLKNTDYENGWYVPSLAELCEVYKNKKVIQTSLTKAGGFTIGTSYYWSSSQGASTTKDAYHVYFGDGSVYYCTKTYNSFVFVLQALTAK